MTDNLRFFCYGAAMVIDTALLLAVFERRNWRFVIAPVVMLLTGAWLFHTGVFSHALVWDTQGGWSSNVRWLAMMFVSGGLLLMPAALLHGSLRVWRSGFQLPRKWDLRYSLCYSPLLLLPLVARSIWRDPMLTYLDLTEPYVWSYLAFACGVNIVASVLLLRERRRFQQPELRRFLGYAAACLVALAVITPLLMLARSLWPEAETTLLLVVCMLPIPLTLLFAYFVIRFNFMQLVLERTFVYGAFLAGGVLFHQIVVTDLSERISGAYRLNIGVLETVLLVTLVLLYQPLRMRAAEALQYLMGRDFAAGRQRVQRLAVELAGVSEQSPEQIVDWFAERLAGAMLAPCGVWIFDREGAIRHASGELRLHGPDAISIYRELERAPMVHARRRDAPSLEVLEHFKSVGASLAVRIEQPGLLGLVLVGRRSRSRELPSEEVNATVLLVEQLGVAMHNQALQRDRMEAERRALQNEKLTALGLLTSCITHEIRNPLSSIKTIASLLDEQLDGDSPYQQDVQLILEEVNRLNDTTTHLLQFARPAVNDGKPVQLDKVLRVILSVLSHLAKQRGVKIHTTLNADLPEVVGDENALREIFFNLLSNSIEAAGPNGDVQLSCCRNGRYVVTTLHDSGPGIAPELQDRIFEPFVTTKDTGGGLGLYIVSQRVRELNGEIACSTAPQQGATFTVKLPFASPTFIPDA